MLLKNILHHWLQRERQHLLRRHSLLQNSRIYPGNSELKPCPFESSSWIAISFSHRFQPMPRRNRGRNSTALSVQNRNSSGWTEEAATLSWINRDGEPKKMKVKRTEREGGRETERERDWVVQWALSLVFLLLFLLQLSVALFLSFLCSLPILLRIAL